MTKDEPKKDDETKEEVKTKMGPEKPIERDTKYFVFKANMPLDDYELLKDWNNSCEAKVPVGHGDYRWGKILHDHLYVKHHKEAMTQLAGEVRVLREQVTTLIGMISKLTEGKKKDDDHKGLMK